MTYTDSDPVEASASFLGVWIHDPLDPEGTVRQFLYGKSSRSTAIDVLAQGQMYAGRTYPVFDYGEHQQDQFEVGIVVPHGETWWTDLVALRSFAQLRRTLCLRDNRGRMAFGTITGFGEDDADHGTEVGFTFVRVDYDEAV